MRTEGKEGEKKGRKRGKRKIEKGRDRKYIGKVKRQWSNGLVVKALDSQSRVPCSKPLGGSKVNSAFHPLDVDKMSTRNFWELSGKK